MGEVEIFLSQRTSNFHRKGRRILSLLCLVTFFSNQKLINLLSPHWDPESQHHLNHLTSLVLKLGCMLESPEKLEIWLMLGSYLKRLWHLGNWGVGRVGWASAFLKTPHMILLHSQLGEPAALYPITSCWGPRCPIISQVSGFSLWLQEDWLCSSIWDAGLQGSWKCPS